MRRLYLICGVMAGWLLAGGAALAAERTVTLEVANMTCVTCPYIVRASLADVPGVSGIEVSYERRTAVVTFDDSVADVAALTAATAKVGFPSRPAE